MINTTIKEEDGRMVVVLQGSLNTAAVPETEKAVLPLYECEGKDIVFECTDLTYISSGGLRILLSVLQDAEKKGLDVFIKGVSDDVRAVFAMTGFVHIFKFL